jgi:hypothetical protein
MARDESKRLNPSVLASDTDSFSALQAITTYTPANSAFATAAINTIRTNLLAAQHVEAQAAAAAATARDNAVANEWEFHNAMIGAKDQVVAQYGRDSNEAQAVGRKKTSEYKPRTRKAKVNPA